MIKKLSAEGRFEAGVDDIMRNKVFAFVAVVGENYPWRLGLAVANEQGYNPVPEFWANGDDMDAFHAHADELNEAMGLSKDQALNIVASTMRGRRYNPEDHKAAYPDAEQLADQLVSAAAPAFQRGPEEDDSYPPPCSNPGGHSWVVRDDNEEISYCEFCGADGNA